MNSGDANGRDDRIVGAYRAAAEALDEQPQAATRAAILAAAARAVEAQPHDAQTGVRSRRQAATQTPRGIAPSKRPLALVASVLVATVAIVIATQVDRQPAEKHAPVAGAPSGPSDALKASKADAADAVVPRSERDNAEGQARRDSNAPAGQQVAVGAPLVDSSSAVAEAPRKTQLARANPVPPTPPASAAPASPSTAAAPPPNATAGMAPSTAAPAALPSAARATPPTMQAEAAPAAAGAIVQLPAAPPVATAPPAQAAAEGGEGTTAGAPEPKQEARAKVAQPAMRALAQSEETRVKERAAPARPQANVALAPDAAPGKRLAKARPVERTAAMVESEVENDPARWMERIIALRDAGRDADADRELARLRERYPEMQVPANALRRAGTR